MTNKNKFLLWIFLLFLLSSFVFARNQILIIPGIAGTSGGNGSVGPAGPQGPPGNNGSDGQPGANGSQGSQGNGGLNLTILNITNNGDGTYLWHFSDGTDYTTGNLTGPEGSQGISGLQGNGGNNGTTNASLITTGVLASVNGGTGLSSAPNSSVLINNGNIWITSVIPDCDNTLQKLQYDNATFSFSCVSGSYHTIQSNGTNQTQQVILNFIGTGVSVTNEGAVGLGRTNVTINAVQGLQGNGGNNGTTTADLNYTFISLHAGRSVTTNLGVARLNWSAAVFDFSEQKIPQPTQIRIGCSASVTGTQTGDLIFGVMVGSTFLTNICTITSNVVAMNTAVTNYEAIPASSGNVSIVLSVNDSVSTDDPIIYSAWVEMRKP